MLGFIFASPAFSLASDVQCYYFSVPSENMCVIFVAYLLKHAANVDNENDESEKCGWY